MYVDCPRRSPSQNPACRDPPCRPETTYADLMAANGNAGNVKENKSLYWHPTMYREQNGVYHKSPVWFGTAYYMWKENAPKGYTKAFPDGFKMIAKGVDQHMVPKEKAQVRFTCEAPAPCEGDCTNMPPPPPSCPGTEPEENCFTEPPITSCAVMEASIAFPSCWDGINTDSDNHMSHVEYFTEWDVCPSTHPEKIPEIHLYFRIKPYGAPPTSPRLHVIGPLGNAPLGTRRSWTAAPPAAASGLAAQRLWLTAAVWRVADGGKYLFSDGGRHLHADYFSGWNQTQLQVSSEWDATGLTPSGGNARARTPAACEARRWEVVPLAVGARHGTSRGPLEL